MLLKLFLSELNRPLTPYITLDFTGQSSALVEQQ